MSETARGAPPSRVREADGREAWSMHAKDAACAEVIAASSKRGLFGFALRRGDTELWRPAAQRTLAGLARGERLDVRAALSVVRVLARALAEWESRGWKAEALTPADVELDPPTLAATRLLASLAGHDAPPVRVSARWSSPEVLAGGAWDHAASRYFLGLVAYRLLAGELPDAGKSLREAIETRARYGVAPMPEHVAGELPPGVQAVVLSWLGERGSRPESAAEMARACEELLGLRAKELPKRPSEVVTAKARAPGHRTPRPMPRALAWVPPIVGACALSVGVLWPSEPSRAAPHVSPTRLTGTAPQDCAPCHAKEVSEWQRSVMSQSSKSPMFGALESLVEEQVGKSDRCPNGAGALRAASRGGACIDERSSVPLTGSGGEGWCINCHTAAANVIGATASWSAFGDASERRPLRDALPERAMEGISCAVCHDATGPAPAHGRARGYEGNATWTSAATGAVFLSRPEDGEGRSGIANAGYALDPLALAPRAPTALSPAPHATSPASARDYRRSSEMCGACHDVRLFGTDVLGGEKGEHFKRLRNAYSEWRTWSESLAREGRTAPSCQGCHMSRYPGVCVPARPGEPTDPDCGAGNKLEARAPSDDPRERTHFFTSVDLPLAPGYPTAFIEDLGKDEEGTPVGLRARRNILLKRTFSFALGELKSEGSSLEIPIHLENVGAGHRVPAGFSQEREVWVELSVQDARGDIVYRVGHVERDDEDLHDKSFEAINVSDLATDAAGRPLGVFGARVSDGPDVPRWSPPPSRGGSSFSGSGLVNLQNGFLRCVRCVGSLDERGECQALPGQSARADRFADAAYDLDTGACTSNLTGDAALFETYFPVGALDAERGVAKAPDAIIDTRSAPPGVPLVYRYLVPTLAHRGPFKVRARLLFRAFPPYLVRAFADYERVQSARGLRPSGPQVTTDMLSRVEIVELATAEATVP